MTARKLLLVFLLLATSCGSRIPPLPEIHTASMQPAVRAAVDEALAAAVKDPDSAAASRRLGMLLQAQQENGAAEAVYTRAVALDPTHGPTLGYWAQLAAARGDHKTAVERLRRISTPSLPQRLALANSLRESGDAKASAELCRQLIREDASNATAHYLLGRAAEDSAALAKAIELFPRYGAARFALAALERKQDHPDAAAKLLADYERDKLAVPPIEDPDADALAELAIGPTGLLRRAVRLERNGRLEEAAALQRQALAAEPNLPDAWANLLSLESRLRNDKAVEETYARTPAGNAGAHYNYGVHCLQRQRFPEATAAFRKTLEIAPNHAEAALNLAGLANDASTREALLRRAIASKPGFAQAHLALSELLGTQPNRLTEAIAEARLAVKASRDVRTVSLLGTQLGQTGTPADRQEALTLLREALTLAVPLKQTDLEQYVRYNLQRLEALDAKQK